MKTKLLLACAGIFIACSNFWFAGLYHGFTYAYSGKCVSASDRVNFFGDEVSRIYLFYVNGHLFVGALLALYLLSIYIEVWPRIQIIRLLSIFGAAIISVSLTYYKAGL